MSRCEKHAAYEDTYGCDWCDLREIQRIRKAFDEMRALIRNKPGGLVAKLTAILNEVIKND